MKKKIYGTAVHLHKVYTIEGGAKHHDDTQQAIGILKLAGCLLIGLTVSCIANHIENLEPKTHKLKRK